ncbi:resistin-like alpha [Mesocricetus auratus]|uniref:Resistin-like alpha n=1 Tax=Mesocricetus auratus TaxID=10036 RepID=A0ABM2XYP5_MESAU|nr:resistin-like alpha [Mesocricetus auratus]
MKTTICSLLIIGSLLQLMVPVNTQDNLVYLLERLRDLLNQQERTLALFLFPSYSGYRPSTVPKAPSCTSVKAMGRLASCPTGMIATGCSCGFACGSWNIQNENICHCLCPITDWTAARCCLLS